VSPPETQPQRTVLSWQRAGLGVLGVAALLGHAAVVSGGVLPVVLAAVVALTGLGVLTGLAPARARSLVPAPAPAPAPGAVALATAAVVVTALAAAATLLSR
jgi:putative membrane protein